MTKGKTQRVIIQQRLAKQYTGCDRFPTPFTVCDEPDREYEYYMGRDIEALLKCDAIYMCSGWAGSKGCRAEHAVALIYGKTVIYEDENEALQDIFNRKISIEPADNDGFILRLKSNVFALSTLKEAIEKIGKDMISVTRQGKMTVFDMYISRTERIKL